MTSLEGDHRALNGRRDEVLAALERAGRIPDDEEAAQRAEDVLVTYDAALREHLEREEAMVIPKLLGPAAGGVSAVHAIADPAAARRAAVRGLANRRLTSARSSFTSNGLSSTASAPSWCARRCVRASPKAVISTTRTSASVRSKLLQHFEAARARHLHVADQARGGARGGR